MQGDLIPLNSILIDPDGFRWIVGAVTFTGGERYYMLRSPDSDVALMPAVAVEQWERG
jgi:hypothetical protein